MSIVEEYGHSTEHEYRHGQQHMNEHHHEHEHEQQHEQQHGNGKHGEHGHGDEQHEHEQQHEEGSLRGKIVTIALAAILLAIAAFIEKRFSLPTWQLLLVYLVPYLVAGWETLKEAAEGLMEKDPFDENFLMTVATIGALCIGFLPGAEPQFTEAVFVMLFFQIGELFESYAEGKSRKSIAHLMDIRPDKATVERDGSLVEVNPESIEVDEVVVVRPGEKIPLDGIVLEGSSSLDTVALTGESVPREVSVSDEVVSGCVNLSGLLKIRTTKPFRESTASKIIDLVENAAEKKSRKEAFITRFARIYTPIVVLAAIILAFVPPMLSGNFSGTFSTWLYRALMFLVVSCPCALVISIPLTFFGGIGGASRKGILVKGANYLDLLSDVQTIVFDKTGTLTQGKFAVEAVHPDTCQDDNHTGCCYEQGGTEGCCTSVSRLNLLHLAAHVEHFSTHPIASALRDAFPAEATDGCKVSAVEEIAGKGAKATITLPLRNREKVSVPTPSAKDAGAKVTNTGSAGQKAEGEGIPDWATGTGSAECGTTYTVHVGNEKLMDSIGVKWHKCNHSGTIIHVAIDGKYAGHIVINDQIKEDSAQAIKSLEDLGVGHTVMLTGDRKEVASQIAEKLGIGEYHSELMPADKVSIVEELLKKQSEQSGNSQGTAHGKRRYLAFVGDGINDAPVLARADIGIAMGALGSDAAIEAADIVIMDDKPSKIATAIRIARRTLSIAKQNIWFAIGVKVAVLILATLGIATMWMAVFADVGVTVLAVLNAMRALRVR